MLEMIDGLNVNDRVSKIDFRMHSSIKLNVEVIKMMKNRY